MEVTKVTFVLFKHDTVDRKTCGEVENNQPPTYTKYFMQYKVFYYAKIK